MEGSTPDRHKSGLAFYERRGVILTGAGSWSTIMILFTNGKLSDYEEWQPYRML